MILNFCHFHYVIISNLLIINAVLILYGHNLNVLMSTLILLGCLVGYI